jgi:hypothetical protein
MLLLLLLMMMIYWMKKPQRKTESLLDASREVDLEVNTEKSNYMVASCNQNVG